jgi:hypothetical protein
MIMLSVNNFASGENICEAPFISDNSFRLLSEYYIASKSLKIPLLGSTCLQNSPLLLVYIITEVGKEKRRL